MTAGRHLLVGGGAPLNVAQGFAISKFRLPDARVVRPRLIVAELTTSQWDRIDTAILALPDAATVAGTAAISDELINPHLTAGIPLIPAPEDISYTCTCSADETSPCPHSAAVGLLLTERLRTTPALLFTLRGRPHQHLKKQLHAALLPPSQQEPTTPLNATERATGRLPLNVGPTSAKTPAIPDPVDLNLTPQPPTHLPPHPPPDPLPDLQGLKAAAADAAHRAQMLLDGGEPHSLPNTPGDIARLTSLPHGTPFRRAAMEHLGLDVVSMGHLQLAYSYGGPAGATAYIEAFTVEPDTLAQAQAAIQPLRPAPMATIEWEGNRLTDHAAGVQLRYGHDARWYPYRAPFGIWQPVQGPDADPAQAYRAARRAHVKGRTSKK
ncbi:hypothetical protein [Streptomyces californicus]|uniref:hypothetical protein n=1 Tax=Streptomyces californicus TaxID=67351 RepID=UPI00296FDDDE|nr:hypothetical protein [Streptomyces californicus]MDW4912635.1 hypothetical protein [Streptomyces californicus]